MHEPPHDLPEATLRAWVRAHYGLDIAALEFLPLGYDQFAWVYRVRTIDGDDRFLKLRRGPVNAASLTIARALYEGGATRVVAPLPTADGALWAACERDYSLVLYPFIAGEAARDRGMTARQWREYGALLRQVHDTPVTPALAATLRRETYVPAGAPPDDPVARDLAIFWRAEWTTIRTVLIRAEELGRRLAEVAPPLVLCHADIHTANVLVGDDGQVWFVDWDEATRAPRERDLMFVVGGISATLVRAEDEAAFFTGYGATAIDPLALAYYRYAWAVSDIGAFGEEIAFRPDLSADSRRGALGMLQGLFKPGEIVDLALGTATLP